MTTEIFKKLVYYSIRMGLMLSIALVFIGGLLYLYQNGSDLYWVDLKLKDVSQHSSGLNIIKYGLYLLIFTQLLRLALLSIYFILQRKWWLFSLSISILLTLCLPWAPSVIY